MAILHIEHSVPDYDAWKTAFDNDPLDRRASGVRRYRVLRSPGDHHAVAIDLEFDDVASAEAMHDKLRTLWSGPARGLMMEPTARVLEVVDDVEL